LAHDRLIQPVLKDNERWRSEKLDDTQRLVLLWESQRRPESLLLTGADLVRLREWTTQQSQPTAGEIAFLEESEAAQKALDRQLFSGLDDVAARNLLTDADRVCEVAPLLVRKDRKGTNRFLVEEVMAGPSCSNAERVEIARSLADAMNESTSAMGISHPLLAGDEMFLNRWIFAKWAAARGFHVGGATR
jgi:hypothetical protein